MPRITLALARETLAELTSDDLTSVVGAAESDTQSCHHPIVCAPSHLVCGTSQIRIVTGS